MGKIFNGLRPFQKAELLIMMLLAFAIPIHWLAAQYCEVALLLCAVLKVVFEQRFKPNRRQMKFKWAYIIFAMTWLAYLVGMIHTENQAVGWAQVSKKLGFLIFPLIFMFSDMSYLNRDRIRAIFYCLVASTLVFFLFNFVWALYDVIIKGMGTTRMFNYGLMKLYYVHHSYMAMYVMLAMVFCVVEIFEQESSKLKIFNSIAVVLLMVFVFLLESRAGLLFMILEIIVLWVWITFVKKKKRFGMISLGAVAAILIMLGVAAPDVYSRLANTVRNLTSENRTDRRLVQLKGCVSVIENNWMTGVGTGDRSDEILASFVRYRDNIVEEIVPLKDIDNQEFKEKRRVLLQKMMEVSNYDGYNEPNEAMLALVEQSEEYGCDIESVRKTAVKYLYIENAIYFELNTHNQYVDVIISVGIAGLLLLLAYFLIPLVLWIKTNRFDIIYFSFLFMIGFNALFESVFEVQMGIIFFCFFNVLLFGEVFVSEKSIKITE